MNNYSCNLQIVSFSAVKNGFISPAGVGNRALGGDPQPSRGWTVGSSSPSSLSLPMWTLQGSPCTPQTPPEKAATVPQERWKHCWLLEPFWFRDEASNYENTPKTRKKRLIRQSQVCTGGLSMEKLPFIQPPPSPAAHSPPHATGRGRNRGVLNSAWGKTQSDTNTSQLSVLTGLEREKTSSGSKTGAKNSPAALHLSHARPPCQAQSASPEHRGWWHRDLLSPGTEADQSLARA